MVKPETVGFSSERLERLHAVMQQEVDQKQLAGAVTILARHGKDRGLSHLRRARHGQRRADDEGHDLPRLLHDQAGDRRGHDDPVRTRQVAADRSRSRNTFPSSRT